MKQILSISALTLTVLISACTKNTVENKAGISLPTVNNLSVSPLNDSVVHVSWELPGGINENIMQPLNVYLEVKEVVSSARIVSVFNITIPDNPSSYDYQLPDPAKTYHITVKLNGMVNSTDPNYSNNIFSLGQTVIR